jgi:hypothetical protein
MQPLIEEAAKKAAVAWLSVPDAGAAYPVWCAWFDGALYVIGGAGEQRTPGLAAAAETRSAEVTVTLRGDHGGRIVTWPAEISVLAPATPEWETIAPQLAGKRLNAPGTATETVERWAATGAIYQLRPAGDATAAGPTLPDADLATEVRESPAVRVVPRPFRLHRVRRR